MSQYTLSNSAKEDLKRIYDYGFYNFGEARADEYFLKLFNQFDQIVKQPLLFSAVDYIRPNYRRCVCGVDSIYYLIDKTEIKIVRIIRSQDFK